jgi:predicted CXXCH cytochrome family protein
MKQLLTVCFLGLLALSTVAYAGVAGTRHDFTGGGAAPDLGTELCVFCHTPHNSVPDVPLWNHVLSTETYAAYTSATINSTGTGEIADWDGNNGSISGLCMSCHDGTLGIGLVTNPSAGIDNSTTTVTGVYNLGTDLTNDHPVSFRYSSSIDGGDNELQSAPTNSAVLLFGDVAGGNGTVECASCHDPHNDTAGEQPFLVTSNTGSAICTACHIK